MKGKLHHLLMVKDCMNEDEFRFTVARVLTNHCLQELDRTGRKMNRMKLLDRVNLSLRSIGIKEVSYEYMRKYV
ncbi:hypothetical protein [Lederbergia citri]|uniref:Uncharacterized protein n=1 Tax=Lederbergia citri TaxID=2833580 RepID=A0A942TCR1_9BACI|nr:hypothetical protein [Lederbergia citri]MBS4194353.1 hypothetical protein [Lederbergia citri]